MIYQLSIIYHNVTNKQNTETDELYYSAVKQSNTSNGQEVIDTEANLSYITTTQNADTSTNEECYSTITDPSATGQRLTVSENLAYGVTANNPADDTAAISNDDYV